MFDEDFLMYMEDVDYSIRCKDLGWKILYSPNSVVYCKYHSITSSATIKYLRSRNRLLLIGKHFPQKLAESIETSHFYIKRELRVNITPFSAVKTTKITDTNPVNQPQGDLIMPDFLERKKL